MRENETVKIVVKVKEQVMTLHPCTAEVPADAKVEFVFEQGSATVIFVGGDSPFKEKAFQIGRYSKGEALKEVIKEKEKSYAYYVTDNPKAGGTIIIRPIRK